MTRLLLILLLAAACCGCSPAIADAWVDVCAHAMGTLVLLGFAGWLLFAIVSVLYDIWRDK